MWSIYARFEVFTVLKVEVFCVVVGYNPEDFDLKGVEDWHLVGKRVSRQMYYRSCFSIKRVFLTSFIPF
jgi:hypothetical protein